MRVFLWMDNEEKNRKRLGLCQNGVKIAPFFHYLDSHNMFHETLRKILKFHLVYAILKIKKAPTPKWMLPSEDLFTSQREAPLLFADRRGIIFFACFSLGER